MQRHFRFKLTAVFCLALAGAGCAGDPDRSEDAQAVADVVNVVFHRGKWQQIPATPENQAETIVFEQRVAFDPGSALLDRGATADIDRLLREAAPTPGSVIRLSAAAPDGTATFDRLTLQRLESLRAALAVRGYETALADSDLARVAALDADEIGLTVTRVMAVLPDCSQPQPLEPDPPVFERGFGCSNAYNFGLMVADPADLERGRPLDPADAERAALGIQRYRIGEEEPLVQEDTKSQ